MTTKAPWQIDPPQPAQRESILALLPRLADFDLPAGRNPRHLWEGDATLVREWFAGTAKNAHLLCACNAAGELGGIALFTLRPELLSDTPSAHLEALAVDQAFEGTGAASALMDACHEHAQRLGARSMTLHVFDNNQRALGLYQHKGYAPELHLCIKWFEQENDREEH